MGVGWRREGEGGNPKDTGGFGTRIEWHWWDETGKKFAVLHNTS